MTDRDPDVERLLAAARIVAWDRVLVAGPEADRLVLPALEAADRVQVVCATDRPTAGRLVDALSAAGRTGDVRVRVVEGPTPVIPEPSEDLDRALAAGPLPPAFLTEVHRVLVCDGPLVLPAGDDPGTLEPVLAAAGFVLEEVGPDEEVIVARARARPFPGRPG